jgi:hypothetical protein
MKKALTHIAIFVWALFAAHVSATPVIIEIDTFNSGVQLISDVSADGIAVTSRVPERFLSTNLLMGMAPIGNTAEVTGGVRGFLDITNGSGEDSEVRVAWNLAAGALPTSAQSADILLTVLRSDGNATVLSFYLNGTLFAVSSIPPNATDLLIGAHLSAGQRVVASLGGILELVINGATSSDVSLDSIRLSYEPPALLAAPASLALLGLGFFGLSFRASRYLRRC